MVLNIAGYALGRIRGTRELLHASYDAFQGTISPIGLPINMILTLNIDVLAATDAADAGRIHRDITPANIILSRDYGAGFDSPRKGYLCDWDLSRPTNYINGEDYEVSVSSVFFAGS